MPLMTHFRSVWDVKVFQSGGRIVVLYEGYEQPLGDILFGYRGVIQSDGTLPNGNEWTRIQMNYEKKPDTHFSSVSYSAAVVPQGFE